MKQETTKGVKVNIEEIIRNKNPRLLKLLPSFIINYIKRVIHQDEVNAFLAKHGDKQGIEFAEEVLNLFNVKIKVLGLENIPSKEGCILASNHPLGGLDAMVFIKAVQAKRSDIKFLVNDILMVLDNFKSIFLPVNKHGKNSKNYIKQMEEAFASDQAIMVFPAGLVSRKQKGVIRDLEWKKSFISQSKKYKKAVVPVHIGGANSSFFYNLAIWRKRLFIKANIEMFYLVDEMFRQTNKTITITIGKPIPYTHFTSEKSDLLWAREIKDIVYKMESLS